MQIYNLFSPALDALINCIKENSKHNKIIRKNYKVETELIDNVGFPDAPIIELSNVSFKYPNSDFFTLKNIDLTFEIGRSYAIVGPSGAGKSTLQDLILGLLPSTKGAIFLKESTFQYIKTDFYIIPLLLMFLKLH